MDARKYFLVVLLGVCVIFVTSPIKGEEVGECGRWMEFTCSGAGDKDDCKRIVGEMKKEMLDPWYGTETFQDLDCTVTEEKSENIRFVCDVPPLDKTVATTQGSLYCGRTDFSLGFREESKPEEVRRVRGFLKSHVREESHFYNYISSHEGLGGEGVKYDETRYLENVSDIDKEGKNHVKLEHCGASTAEGFDLCQPIAQTTTLPSTKNLVNSSKSPIFIVVVLGFLGVIFLRCL